MIPFLLGSFFAVGIVGAVIFGVTGRKSLRGSYIWAAWVALAVYGAGSRDSYDFTQAGCYILAAAVWALVGHFVDGRRARKSV